jgi:hypothetical protein
MERGGGDGRVRVSGGLRSWGTASFCCLSRTKDADLHHIYARVFLCVV